MPAQALVESVLSVLLPSTRRTHEFDDDELNLVFTICDASAIMDGVRAWQLDERKRAGIYANAFRFWILRRFAQAVCGDPEACGHALRLAAFAVAAGLLAAADISALRARASDHDYQRELPT